MKDYLQSTNTKNAHAIGNEFELSYEDFEYIRYEFWPIIIFNDKTISEFETYLEVEKSNFINKHNFFDLDIFKREYLEIWLYDFNEYLDNIKKGQSRIWIKKKDVYFHRFKLKNDIKSYTMILTNKDSTGLEIYLKQVVKTINTFIKNNEDKTPKEMLADAKLSDLITSEKSIQIVNDIKIRYKNIKGRRLKLLLLALQDLNLLPKERIASAFHRRCEKEFKWDIATYPAMNDYVFNLETDDETRIEMKEFLQGLINTK
jgi:hypothetical protein